MARANREYQIRPMVCDWALDIPMGDTTFVLHFNSRNNAELVKAVLEWEDSHPNEAIPYQPTITPPNEPLTLEELRKMSYIDWVWVVYPGLPPEENEWFRASELCKWYSHEHYGKTWIAYRRPPEVSP